MNAEKNIKVSYESLGRIPLQQNFEVEIFPERSEDIFMTGYNSFNDAYIVLLQVYTIQIKVSKRTSDDLKYTSHQLAQCNVNELL